ncbi:MAG: hypothetical protein ACNS62_22235 [Candidatus Cyclobacteriaceae bacterium M3_2C_046]
MKNRLLQKVIIMSKYTFIGFTLQFFLLGISIASNSEAQLVKPVSEVFIDMGVINEKLIDVFHQIEMETDYEFHYYEDVDVEKRIFIDKQRQTLSQFLLKISELTDLSFRQVNSVISVKPIEEGFNQKSKIEIIIQGRKITGTVTSSEDDEPLPGVNVIEKGTSNGSVTDIGNINSSSGCDGLSPSPRATNVLTSLSRALYRFS